MQLLITSERNPAYLTTAYEAGRMRVEDITVTLLNKPAAELYSSTTLITLESTTMRPQRCAYIRTSNSAVMNAKLQAIANKDASLPSGTGDDFKSKMGYTASRRQRLAEKSKQAEEKAGVEDAKKKHDATKKTDTARKTTRETPEAPMNLPPRRAAESRLGTCNPVEVSAVPDMVGADEGDGEVARFGLRFSGAGVFAIWQDGQPDIDLKPSKLSTGR
jgi:hypothetical protein